MHGLKLPAGCLIAAFLWGAAPAGAADRVVDAAALADYAQARDFKALAVATPAGRPAISRFAFNYDTARDAARAALAYCRKAITQTDLSPPPTCRVTRFGAYQVNTADPADLDNLAIDYQEKVIARLYTGMAATNARPLRTTLTTILQKIGRFKESESLLIDLARAGEDLAQNALAYHWAELEINLDQALAYSQAAIARRPDFFSYRDTQSMVLYKKGQLDKALQASRLATRLKPHPIALDHLGDILWALHRRIDAQRTWETAARTSRDILFTQRVSAKAKDGPMRGPVFK